MKRLREPPAVAAEPVEPAGVPGLLVEIAENVVARVHNGEIAWKRDPRTAAGKAQWIIATCDDGSMRGKLPWFTISEVGTIVKIEPGS